MKGLLQGLHNIHKKGVVHRDIKPENILIEHQNVPAFADFGIAITVEELSKFRVIPIEGTVNYIAPETHLVISHR